MKFKPGDMVFMLQPDCCADIGKVLEVSEDGYIIHMIFQEENTAGEYLPGFFSKKEWDSVLYHPYEKKKEIILFLFDYPTFDKRYL